MEHFSLSQARLAISCPLAWRHRYMGNGPTGAVTGLAASEGSDMDNLLNLYFEGRRDDLSGYDDNVLADFEAIIHKHPCHTQATPQVEIIKVIEGIDLPVLGYADLVSTDIVYEHKRGGGWDEAWWAAARRQVALYADALEIAQGTIIQVKDQKVRIETFGITEDLVRSVHDELRAGWKARMQAAKPGPACGWCDYENDCDMSVFRRFR